MIQNNLLESETALFSKKGGKKQRHSIERWTLSSVFGIIRSLSHAFCTYILYPEFFSRGPVLPVGLVTKQVTRDTGAGS